MESELYMSLYPKRGFAKRLKFSVWKYIAVLRISIANNLAYTMALFFRALMLIVLIFIFTQLWSTTFSLHHTKLLSGFSMNDMIWYLVTAEAIALSLPTLSQHIDREVRSGQLAYSLGRPCNYVMYHFALYLGERLVRLLMNCVVGSLLALLVVGPPHFSWIGVIAWLIVVLFAICIDFVAYFCIGLLAFWTESTQSFATIFSHLTLMFGGVLAPLDIFPQPLRNIIQALPFSAILYGPAQTLVHFEWNRLRSLLLYQMITLAIGIAVLQVIYRMGIRRVNINGG